MKSTFLKKQALIFLFIWVSGGCAYFNTFYNAQQYFKEAEKIRLEKEGETISISSLDKYGKSIEKCQKVLTEFPDSKFKVDAILLMGKARYYRKDYNMAIENLKIVDQEGNEGQIEESSYWQSLCKWKKGNIQASIDDLTYLESTTRSKNIQSKCHLSLAEIRQELKEFDLSMEHLQLAAKYSKDRNEKGVIYGQLAEMAFKKESYELAMDGYEKVISNSLSKGKIEKAHLQILKILRIQKKFRQASRKIKGMLTDGKFKQIAGNLELELVQLYKAQGDDSEIETRLESITNDYQRTSVSAEAYFLLGEIYTSEKWNLDKAKEYFSQVSKEYSKSLFKPMAKSKMDAIELYLVAMKDLETHLTIHEADSIEFRSDSLEQNVSVTLPDRPVPELYYQLGDLEAFRFNRFDKGITYLVKIIDEFPESLFKPKAIFTLGFMYRTNGDTVKATDMENILLNDYPNSEYTSYLSDDVVIEIGKQEILFSEAETQYQLNPSSAVEDFKNVINLNPNSELAVSAAYTVSYYYDEHAKIDSALKYYQWIIKHHPKSDHATPSSNKVQLLQSVIAQLTVEKPDSISTSQDSH